MWMRAFGGLIACSRRNIHISFCIIHTGMPRMPGVGCNQAKQGAHHQTRRNGSNPRTSGINLRRKLNANYDWHDASTITCTIFCAFSRSQRCTKARSPNVDGMTSNLVKAAKTERGSTSVSPLSIHYMYAENISSLWTAVRESALIHRCTPPGG